MKRIGFYLVKCWADFQSIQPYWLLYLKSDLCYFLVYHVAHYRRKVVRENLLRSFPEKDVKEIKTIEKRFYRNLCDLFVEAPKMMCMGPNGYSKRITYANPEVLNPLFEQQKSIFYAIPHSGNWEWFGKMIPSFAPHHNVAVYKKVKSPVFDELMLYMRSKGISVEPVEADSAFKHLVKHRNRWNAVLMIADQTPHGLDSDYWTEFLHQDTCWFTGMERMAKALDYAIVFVAMQRQGRGRYEVRYELITDNPKAMGEGQIMEKYVSCVERFIQANPDNWLWSHRRWKHQRNQVVA
jgi:KDO2-lipid IV(A) lauroyltransferase